MLENNLRFGVISMQINKWVAPVPSSSSQVRNLRKVNNDQVAIAIDEDPVGKNSLEDEDDDKGSPTRCFVALRCFWF